MRSFILVNDTYLIRFRRIKNLIFCGLGIYSFLHVLNVQRKWCLLAVACLLSTPELCYLGVGLKVDAIVMMFVFLCIVFGITFMLHFMLSFPIEKKILQKKHTLKFLYAPGAILIVIVILRIILLPNVISGLNMFFYIFVSLFSICFFGLAIITMIHSFIATSA